MNFAQHKTKTLRIDKNRSVRRISVLKNQASSMPAPSLPQHWNPQYPDDRNHRFKQANGCLLLYYLWATGQNRSVYFSIKSSIKQLCAYCLKWYEIIRIIRPKPQLTFTNLIDILYFGINIVNYYVNALKSSQFPGKIP